MRPTQSQRAFPPRNVSNEDSSRKKRQGLKQVLLRALQPPGDLTDGHRGRAVPRTCIVFGTNLAGAQERRQQNLHQREHQRPTEQRQFLCHVVGSASKLTPYDPRGVGKATARRNQLGVAQVATRRLAHHDRLRAENPVEKPPGQ